MDESHAEVHLTWEPTEFPPESTDPRRVILGAPLYLQAVSGQQARDVPSEYARLCGLGALGPQGESPVNTTPKGKEALHTASISVWALGKWPLPPQHDPSVTQRHTPFRPSGLQACRGGWERSSNRRHGIPWYIDTRRRRLILVGGPRGRATDKGAELPTDTNKRNAQQRPG